MEPKITQLLVQANSLRAELNPRGKDMPLHIKAPKGMFPGQDDHPTRFQARSKIVVPTMVQDTGTRPLSRVVQRGHGLSAIDQNGLPTRTLRANQKVTFSARVLNLGNADAPATNVEFFISYRHLVTKNRTEAVPADKMRVEDVFSISGRGTFATGPVISGAFQIGDTVTLPNGRSTIIVDIIRRNSVAFLLRGVNRHEISRGDTLSGRPERQERITVRQIEDDGNLTSAVDFIGVRYVDIPCERNVIVSLPWHVPAFAPRNGRPLSATLYVRAYGFLPTDVPASMSRLDPVKERHICKSVFKIVL